MSALGARFSHDKRVLVSGDKTWLSAGWKWFTQTRVFDDTTLVSQISHLRLLQAICVRILKTQLRGVNLKTRQLATIYASGISHTHSWIYTGAGIRMALDIGAHKRRAYGAKPSLEDELYKRAFW